MPAQNSHAHPIRRRLAGVATSVLAGLILTANSSIVGHAQEAANPPLAQATPPSSNRSPQLQDGTFSGQAMDAYFGYVQVAAVIQGGRIVSVQVLEYPNDRGRSRSINDYALPILQKEVIKAQNAKIDIISGATLTCDAYARSLATALTKARVQPTAI